MKNLRNWVIWAINKKALPWCYWKYLITWSTQIPKTSIAGKFLKRCHSQTVIFDLSKTSIPKNNTIWVISAIKKKEFYWCFWKYPFTWGRHIGKTSIAGNILEKVSLLNNDLCSLSNRHSRKQQNLGYLSLKEKTISVVPLKIPFHVRQTHAWNFHRRKNSWKCVVVKLWSLISSKPVFPKTTESELLEQ